MKRNGITLLEVLMAIFIMGIGMMSVFALFPVAALMMGQSIERYQINETVSISKSNFDADVLEFIKNKPDSLYLGNSNLQLNKIPNSFLNYPLTSPNYLFLDQAAGITKATLGGVPVAYVNIDPSASTYDPRSLINERFFTLNYDIELDESGRAVTPVSAQGKYSVAFLLEKKAPLDNPLPSRRYMLLYKGRSQSFPDFPASAINAVNPNNAITVQNSVFYETCKKNDWIMLENSSGERSFHKITSLNVNNELEVSPKFYFKSSLPGPPVIPPVQPINVYLLVDVVRVIDLGAG